MKPTSLQEIAVQCGGELVSGDGAVLVDTVSTDTRSLAGGELFAALAGDNFDAHDFLGQATGAGVAAVLVSRDDLSTDSVGKAAVIRVADTLVGLQSLAAAQREVLNPKVVAITGSSGKTSTKDMLSAVLAKKFSVNATLGNLNNHIGLPLTVLATQPDHEAVVWELGMNHRGEIAPLAAIAKPDVAVITNVGVAHIEHLGTREEICAEKGDLIGALGADGVAIFPDADDYADQLEARCPGRSIRTVIDAPAPVSARDLVVLADGATRFTLDCEGDVAEVTLAVPGRHMVSNALLAAAVGHYYGISAAQIAEALAGITLTGGRLERRDLNGVSLLDDSYNANPESMAAALHTLGEIPCAGRRIAVLGRMAELGDIRETEHRRAGAIAAEAKIDLLCTVGDEADWIGLGAQEATDSPEHHHFSDHAACAEFLSRTISPGDNLLLKGSRSARMEAVLETLSLAPTR